MGIEQRLTALSKDLRFTDTGSVLTQDELIGAIWDRIHQWRSTHQEQVLDAYETGGISRRDFLKMIGLVGASGVAASAGITAIMVPEQREQWLDTVTGFAPKDAAGSYDTWKIPSGSGTSSIPDQYWDGNTLSNLLIDQTASNAAVKHLLTGGDTVKNVGVKGTADVSGNNYIFAIQGSGDITIENVYMGEGATEGSDYMGLYASGGFSAKCHITNVYNGLYSDNGMYIEEPQSDHGSGGTMHINACFTHNNNISHYRIGNGSTLRNSVAVNSNKVRAHANGGLNSRGCHCFYAAGNDGHVTAENVHVNITDSNTQTGSAIDIEGNGHKWVFNNCQIKGAKHGNYELNNCGNNPETTPPSGCPCTPEEAAGGSA